MSQEKAYIEILSRELGAELRVSSGGAVSFEQDGCMILLQWKEAENSFVVYAELGYLSGVNDEAVCRSLLSANFLLLESGGGALSYDSINNKVGYNYPLPVYGLSAEDFLQKLNAVLVMAGQWKNNFEKMKKEQEKLVLDKIEADTGLDNAADVGDLSVAMQFIKV